jgi:hypothetical protein
MPTRCDQLETDGRPVPSKLTTAMIATPRRALILACQIQSPFSIGKFGSAESTLDYVTVKGVGYIVGRLPLVPSTQAYHVPGVAGVLI